MLRYFVMHFLPLFEFVAFWVLTYTSVFVLALIYVTISGLRDPFWDNGNIFELIFAG